MKLKVKEVKVNNTHQTACIIYNLLSKEDKLDKDKEHFWVLGLDCINKIEYVDLVSLGVSTYVTVEPKETYRMAIRSGVENIIVAHNHPSGEVNPSEEDINITSKLQQAGNILNIKLLDHLIIGNNGNYYSILNKRSGSI